MRSKNSWDNEMTAQQKINIGYQWKNTITNTSNVLASGNVLFWSEDQLFISVSSWKSCFLPLQWTFRAETYFNSDTIKVLYCGGEERHPRSGGKGGCASNQTSTVIYHKFICHLVETSQNWCIPTWTGCLTKKKKKKTGSF